jgi:hypothetical protein
MLDAYSARKLQKQTGAFFTSDHVAASLVSWAVRRVDDRLLDPACGDGQFISLHRNCVGIEQNARSAHEAVQRSPAALVHEGDFFTWASKTSERFECASGNPPFIRYQAFSGDLRRRALALCAAAGVEFSGLAASWAPFIVATAALLKVGGRMAFVVPAEIGHAPYAAPLLEFLLRSFSSVHVIAVREKLFPKLSEDCWLLYAEGFGGRTSGFGLTIIDEFRPCKRPPPLTKMIDAEEWRSIWGRRLRPYLLPSAILRLYEAAATDPDSRRFADFASVGIGYVSGANNFFHLRPSVAKQLRIPAPFLHATVRNGRAMPNRQITHATVGGWKRADEQVLLLRLQRGQELPASIRRYLNTGAGKQAQLAYKCRNREPWYVVPDVQIPDYIMTYMSGRTVSLVRNSAGVTCTNSVHSVRIRDRALAAKLLRNWSSSFVRLSCEIEGHALGGGMLKLEPREASRVLFPSENIMRGHSQELLEEAMTTMHRWRHYAE